MRRGERIPLHDHSDSDSGGIVAATVARQVAQSAGSTAADPGGSSGSVTIEADTAHVVEASGASVELDFEIAEWFDITLTDDCTLTIVNAPVPPAVGEMHVILRQGSGAPYTVTWPAEVDWPDTAGTGGGSAPTLWTAETALDVIVLTTLDGGTTYGGSYDGTGGGGGPVALDDLTDVDTSGVSDGDLLSYDLGSTTWVPIAAPSGSVPSGTDPGDLLVWDGDSWEVLPVGTDGQIIYADSGETLGLLWDDAPAGGGGSAYAFPLDVPPGSAHAKDDEFNGTSLDGKWTNPATSTRTNTITVGNGALYLEPSDAGTGSTGSHGGYGIRQAAPASDFTIMAKVAMICPSGSAGETRAGIFVADTGTPKVNILGTIRGGFGRLVNADGATYSESSDWSGYDGYDAFVGPEWLAPVWLRIRWVVSSSTLFFDFSANGYIWQNLNSRGSSVQPNRIGIVQWSNGTDIPKDNVLAVDWFRVTEP